MKRRLAVGDRVSGGRKGTQDYDEGRIVSLENGVALVAWDSGVRTSHPTRYLRSIGRKNPSKAVRLSNFTGTIRRNANGTVSVVGRAKRK